MSLGDFQDQVSQFQPFSVKFLKAAYATQIIEHYRKIGSYALAAKRSAGYEHETKLGLQQLMAIVDL